MFSSLSKTDRSFFKAAQSASLLSDHNYSVGCVIVHKHRIISSGCNSNTKCHRIQAVTDMKLLNCASTGKLHAEMRAMIPLLKTNEDYSKATLYVYREHKDGTLAMARPCSRCLEVIKLLGIRKIKYTTEDGYACECLEV